MLLNVNNINCRYSEKVIINDLSFSLDHGQIACLLGPSGCGKTTALRAIAGFENIFGGSIELENHCLSNKEFCTPPESRQIGMVFQDYALFPHLDIQANISFGLQSLNRSEKKDIVNRLLALIKLEEYASYYPHQLSGGQQQRVALARALAPEPKLLLMDEPFSNLDTELRRSLSLEVRHILKQRNTSAILVTHDQAEAFTVADEVGIMAKGELQQWGSEQEIMNNPANQFVQNFIIRN